MALSFGSTTIRVKKLETLAGTVIVNSTGRLNPDYVKGYRVPIPFSVIGKVTSTATYCNIGAPISTAAGTITDLATGTAKLAYLPWAGSVLGLNVKSGYKHTAGHVTFTAYNGTTALAVSATLNTTNFKNASSATLTSEAQAFTANNLKVKMTSSADCAPSTTQGYNGWLWVEV